MKKCCLYGISWALMDMKYKLLGAVDVTSVGIAMVGNHHVCWDFSPMTTLIYPRSWLDLSFQVGGYSTC